MSVVPGNVDTDRQPPMTVPLQHFLVGLGFLLVGSLLGAAVAVGASPGRASLAHVHLLLVGWVCVTIMGAMTQFVPVWSGVRLHSRRLAVWQLRVVVAGLFGFAGGLLVGSPRWLPTFGLLMLGGFWLFVYNVGRTLSTVEGLDVTERHFAIALGFFLLLTVLGVLLAVDLVVPVLGTGVVSVLGTGEVTHASLLGAHATVAVFGAVLTTVLGALYQLATMFTQTELHGVDVHLRRFEEVAYPVGVAALATGRLLDAALVATAGGVLVAAAIGGFAVVLARKLHEMRVPWTPMHRRYAVVALAMALWAVLALPAWVANPLDTTVLLGAPGTAHLLVLGVVGFVVLGTLYHVVPFIVWVHRYSDRLGFEEVPMIDDLYDDRIALADFAALVAGTGGVVLSEWFGLPATIVGLGGLVVTVGVAFFFVNMLLVVGRHSPYSVVGILLGTYDTDAGADPVTDDRQANPDTDDQ